jgi:hypothetical protein
VSPKLKDGSPIQLHRSTGHTAARKSDAHQRPS